MAAPLRRTDLTSDQPSATFERAGARCAARDELLDRLELEIDRRIEAERRLREVERQLTEAEDMQAVVYQVASAVHDLNNLMSVAISGADWILKKLAIDDPSRATIEDIRTASHRAADLVSHLLDSARPRAPDPKICNLKELLLGAESMMRHVLGAERELELIHAPGLGSVRFDPMEMENVLLNLVANARDAMPLGGKLTIQTRNPGGSVVIDVRDTGVGMHPSTAARIFEPFFTTKARGTGLGLWSVLRKVKQHGGDILVNSELGRGTTFEIHLPRAVPELASPPRGR